MTNFCKNWGIFVLVSMYICQESMRHENKDLIAPFLWEVLLGRSRLNQALVPLWWWSVCTLEIYLYFPFFSLIIWLFWTFFFIAATSKWVYSVFADVTNTLPDCSLNDEQFFYIGSNIQSPFKLVSDDSFISICLLCMIVQTGVTRK